VKAEPPVPTDQFDIVRRYFLALNRGDVAAAGALYHDACVTENAFIDPVEGQPFRGVDANARELEAFFAKYAGGLEDGRYFEVRTIGGIGTGWGWVQAIWTLQVMVREDGRPRQARGYTYFLFEDGRIRRQRSISSDVTPTTATVADAPLSDRHYPSRPIVGVGAAILVRDADRPFLASAPAIPSPFGIVLIKRKYEPLAGQWSLPGGTLEIGETLESGTAREIQEETGLVVHVGDVVDVFDRILFDAENRVRYHFVLVDYLCRPIGGALCAGSDVSDVVVADPHDIERYGMTAKAESVIRKAVHEALHGDAQ
jgi:8-oxo-dGTP diphosphatase